MVGRATARLSINSRQAPAAIPEPNGTLPQAVLLIHTALQPSGWQVQNSLYWLTAQNMKTTSLYGFSPDLPSFAGRTPAEQVDLLRGWGKPA